MKRLIGSKKKKRTPERIRTEPSAELEYAIHEYEQTVPASMANDDGRNLRLMLDEDEDDQQQPKEDAGTIPLAESTPRRTTLEVPTSPTFPMNREAMPPIQEQLSGASSTASYQHQQRPQSPVAETVLSTDTDVGSYRLFQQQERIDQPMPDSTYRESYGDAYVGAPIKYIYPSGYQSMRPRGGPWKLSIAICVLFTWLSIFIVGHCSDRASQSYYEQLHDDDLYVIETRWCGSRLLYLMWVMSMLITGLAAAYCSVIGYIKMRDFAVANTRSQPPGMVGKSDYYVSLSADNQSTASSSYQRTIYQADGEPQFWGGHIYRPTQAAVAVTNR
jgi:hypothetical protein